MNNKRIDLSIYIVEPLKLKLGEVKQYAIGVKDKGTIYCTSKEQVIESVNSLINELD